jgi:uncharacterized Tic20 family protein
MNGEDKRRLLSALCHGSIFFSSLLVSVGIPFAIFFAAEDSVVKENAKEALNFHINLYIAAFICVLLISVLIGIPLLFIVGLISFVMPIIGIVSVINNPSKPYRYPFIFRFF